MPITAHSRWIVAHDEAPIDVQCTIHDKVLHIQQITAIASSVV
jgi:hypothetical protein